MQIVFFAITFLTSFKHALNIGSVLKEKLLSKKETKTFKNFTRGETKMLQGDFHALRRFVLLSLLLLTSVLAQELKVEEVENSAEFVVSALDVVILVGVLGKCS